MNKLLLSLLLSLMFLLATGEELLDIGGSPLFAAIESEYPFQSMGNHRTPVLRSEQPAADELDNAVSLQAHMKIAAQSAASDTIEEEEHVFISMDAVEEESVSAAPTETPTATPTKTPTASPTARPSATPSAVPSAAPTTSTPTTTPTRSPTAVPTATPTFTPSAAPTYTITVAPTSPSVLKFNSTFTLKGLDIDEVTDKDILAIEKTTAKTLGVSEDLVDLIDLIQVSSSSTIRKRRQLETSSADLIAKAIVQIIQEVAIGTNPSELFVKLSTQLQQAVQTNNFTTVLQAVSKQIGADATAVVSVTGLTTSDPEITYAPTAPTPGPTKAPSSSKDKSLTDGEIAGIVIGVTFGVVLLIGLFLYLRSTTSKTAPMTHSNHNANYGNGQLVAQNGIAL